MPYSFPSSFTAPTSSLTDSVHQYAKDVTTILDDPTTNKDEVFLSLLTDHCTNWHERNQIKTVGGRERCDSMVTFALCATARVDKTDSMKTLEDFPLVKIHDCFLHDSIPIMRMYLQQASSLMEGLQWHVCSDIFFTGRTEAWWKQVMELFRLLTSRCFQFIQGEWEAPILNVKEYRVEHKRLVGRQAEEVDLSEYRFEEEDEEKRKRMKMSSSTKTTTTTATVIIREGEEKKEVKPVHLAMAVVSETYLYDQDCRITSMWNTAFDHDYYPLPPSIGVVDIANFVSWLLGKYIQEIKEDEVLRFRRIWLEDLIVTDSYRRIHKRISPLTEKPASREIIIYKNDQLYDDMLKTYPTSRKDVQTKPATGNAKKNNLIYRISVDSMFFLYAKSLHPNPGDVCEAVYRKNRAMPHERNVTYPFIFRNGHRGVWELVMSETECFAFMRKQMRENGISCMIGDVNLSAVDSYFFPSTTTSSSQL
jgi:hypothetical protein